MVSLTLILSLLLAGMALGRLSVFGPGAAATLNQYVIHISLPALILLRIPQLRLTSDLWLPLVVPWLMLGLSAALILLLGRLLAWERPVVGGLLLVVPLGNTSFLGLPMIEALWGPEQVPFGLLYDQFGSFPGLALYGPLVVGLYGGAATEHPRPRDILRRMVTFPPLLALLIALLLRDWTLPPALTIPLTRLADTLVPVVMVAVGLQLRPRLPRADWLPLTAGLVLKMGLAPLAALGFTTLVGVTGPVATITVFEAAMPPMITAGAIAHAAGLAPRLTGALVGLGVLLSCATLPLWTWVLRS
ncbi:MAG: AEC family transporter [Magnetococcales bacterium]|nr:AEC family transporter [Magnetococcales bacterium]